MEGPAVSPDQVEVILTGDTGRIKRVGEYMNAGRITVEGDIGMHCGNFMSGGEIVIGGNADAWLGREMRGGRITCRGNAGHYCAAGYRGEKRGMRGGSDRGGGQCGRFHRRVPERGRGEDSRQYGRPRRGGDAGRDPGHRGQFHTRRAGI